MSETILPTPTPTPTPTATPWYEGKVNPEHVGLWQLKQWDISDPAKLADQVTASYREAEKKLGVPSAELLRIPKADDPAGQKAFWQKFGVPTDKSGYGLEGVKFADGTELDAGFRDAFAETAEKLNVPADAAKGLLQHFMKHLEGSEAGETAATQNKLAAQTQALRANWGSNWEANMFIAKQAAQALGVTPEVVATLENAIGYDQVMEFFRNVGVRIGEDRYIAGNGPGGSKGVMTRDAALVQKQQLMNDKDWVKKYTAGDKAAFDQIYALNTLIANASA